MSGDFLQDPNMERAAWSAACQQDEVFERLLGVVRDGSAGGLIERLDSEAQAFIELAGSVNPEETEALEADRLGLIGMAKEIFGVDDQTDADIEMNLISSVTERAGREYNHYRRAQIFCEQEEMTLEEFQETYGPLRVFQTLYGDPAHPDLSYRALDRAVAEGRYLPIPEAFWEVEI